MAQFEPAWFWDRGRLDETWLDRPSFIRGTIKPATLIQSDSRPDGHMYSWIEIHDGRPRILFDLDMFANCPPLWFVNVVEKKSTPPNIKLVGFGDQRFPSGTVINQKEADELKIHPRDAVGATQWGYGDPKVHQVWVHPEWRRKRLALLILSSADMLNMAGNWSNGRVMYGGDLTTNDGEQIRTAYTQSRLIPRSGSAT